MSYSAATNQMPARIATVYQNQVAITPTDNTPIGPFTGLYVGGAGDVTVIPRNSTTPVTYKAVPVGTVLPIAFQGVNATGTTATYLVGLG